MTFELGRGREQDQIPLRRIEIAEFLTYELLDHKAGYICGDRVSDADVGGNQYGAFLGSPQEGLHSICTKGVERRNQRSLRRTLPHHLKSADGHIRYLAS